MLTQIRNTSCAGGSILGPNQGHTEARSGPYWGQIRAILGPDQGHTEARSGPFWGRIRAILRPDQGHTEARSGPADFKIPQQQQQQQPCNGSLPTFTSSKQDRAWPTSSSVFLLVGAGATTVINLLIKSTKFYFHHIQL